MGGEWVTLLSSILLVFGKVSWIYEMGYYLMATGDGGSVCIGNIFVHKQILVFK